MTDMSLNEYDREGDPTRYDAEDRERFKIEGDGQAAWAVRKLRDYQKQLDDAHRIAEDEMARIKEWLNRQESRHASDIVYFTHLLSVYALAQRSENNRKSIDTPYGVVKTRLGQAKYTVEDADALLTWALVSRPDLVKVVQSMNMTALKEACTLEDTQTMGLVAVTSDGEIVPGVRIAAASVSVSVEAAR
jgi:phage host-nuclease inhibitor protein Gam